VGLFKKDIKSKALLIDFKEKDKLEELVQFVFDYDRLILSKEDISKRKRIKNTIPSINRCHAKRANCEQCTRKQKEGFTYCGTHIKGTPHGVLNTKQETENQIVYTEVFAQDIGGIVFYLDKHFNVFRTEDILKNANNPEIISKYEIVDGSYHIPSLGI